MRENSFFNGNLGIKEKRCQDVGQIRFVLVIYFQLMIGRVKIENLRLRSLSHLKVGDLLYYHQMSMKHFHLFDLLDS